MLYHSTSNNWHDINMKRDVLAYLPLFHVEAQYRSRSCSFPVLNEKLQTAQLGCQEVVQELPYFRGGFSGGPPCVARSLSWRFQAILLALFSKEKIVTNTLLLESTDLRQQNEDVRFIIENYGKIWNPLKSFW